jgi:hypothetical protein
LAFFPLAGLMAPSLPAFLADPFDFGRSLAILIRGS